MAQLLLSLQVKIRLHQLGLQISILLSVNLLLELEEIFRLQPMVVQLVLVLQLVWLPL